MADAAIELLGRHGIHGLSHRAVDEWAGLPRGTTSNYFRTRDELLAAAAERVIELHFRWLTEVRGRHPEQLGRERVIEILAEVVDVAVTRHRVRYLAMFQLALESTLRPALGRTLSRLAETSVGLTYGVHVGADLHPSAEEVALMHAFYNGLLFGGLVIPGSLGGQSPGQLVRAMLARVMPVE